MSLQAKVIGLLVAVFTLSTSLEYEIQQTVTLPGFIRLEREAAIRNMERSIQAIERELQQLSVSASDRATWDDSYQYIQDRNQEFAAKNLNLEALRSLKVDALFIVDMQGAVAWGAIYDLDSGREWQVAELPKDRWPPEHSLLALASTTAEVRGLLQTERGPMLVASKPIVTSARQGPIRGAVVMGRFLDAVVIKAIAEAARVSLTIKPAGSIGELAAGNAPAEREADLHQFLELAAQELASLVRQAAQDAVSLSGKVQHIAQNLADQERFSRAQRILEPVHLDELLKQSLDLIRQELRALIEVDIDASVAKVGPTWTARIALQQVFLNLIINAAEAIQQGGNPRGTLRISATRERDYGQDMLHLRFQDSGPGIAQEHLPRLFECGFSTKGRSSGLGLHWSANTIAALSGRLYGASEGLGQGACFHLIIPYQRDDQLSAPAEQAA